jgi:GNAT superfamily N-acetyltransferase
MDVSIKPIVASDLDEVLSMIREFALFEDLSDACQVTFERLEAAMFDPGAVTEGLIARVDGNPAGYALFFPNFSSFRGQRGLYLDDIFVRKEHRASGLGGAMIKEIARIATARGFERIDFLVLDWNKPAQRFYEKLGAVQDPQERHYKFTDAAFQKLAD